MPKEVNFAKELKELEAIVNWFESGQVDLDEALPKFERGMELAAKLKKHLDGFENKVEVIKKKFNAPSTPQGTARSDINMDGMVDLDLSDGQLPL